MSKEHIQLKAVPPPPLVHHLFQQRLLADLWHQLEIKSIQILKGHMLQVRANQSLQAILIQRYLAGKAHPVQICLLFCLIHPVLPSILI